MSDPVSVAVGCAVGIPCGLALIIAFIFWYRMQLRFKKEAEADTESLREEGPISFDNFETLKQTKERGNRENIEKIIENSGSSENTTNDEEKDGTNGTATAGNSGDGKQPQRSGSRYIPAYRQKLNLSLSKRRNSGKGDELKGSLDNSTTSLETPRNQNTPTTVLDQIIPVMPMPGSGSAQFSTSEFSLQNDQYSSNEHLIKNLHNQDFGSYPRRKSSATLSVMNPANQSNSSLHTRASSVHSLSKKSAENIFETPKSQSFVPLEEPSQAADDKSEIYMLKNNYDVSNAEEIAEEDQYENEFTNYSDNKREFINSLRPRKV
ncbi:LAMI_0B00320g1_1 [Lachancea mirantina]|uniref:LAMI_0B00320g1_1 n=1 Tax=Lachancea mirantina TaxID=1230905 RepID=A0A1G4ISR8_9SACH|nr:LAMI_0B00320g1_1 [Lachancea mirantina]